MTGVPYSIIDLSTTAASNSPSGSDSIGNSLDDYLRAIQAILRAESENKSWERWNDTPTRTGASTFTVVGDLTSRYVLGRRLKMIDSSTLYGSIASSSFGSGVTTVTMTMDSGSLSASLTEVQLGVEANTISATAPFIDSTALIKGSSDATKLLRFEVDGQTAGQTRVITTIDADMTMVGLTNTQALTNKSLDDATTFIIDNSDSTKKAKFQVSGITTATTREITIPNKDGTMAMLSDITAPAFTTKFTSTDQTITSGNTLTLAHGLGAVPFNVDFYLVCQTGEFNYTAGDVIRANTQQSSASADNIGMVAKVDATNIVIRFGSATSPFTTNDWTTGGGVNLTNANWKLRVKASV